MKNLVGQMDKEGMKTIVYVLKTQRRITWSVAPNCSVENAMKLMMDTGMDALPVLEAGVFVGIIFQKDCITNVILKERSSKETLVREIMKRKVVSAFPEQTVQRCLALMNEKRIRYLPIMTSGELSGVVSMEDLFRTIITDQKELIASLENHILETGVLCG